MASIEGRELRLLLVEDSDDDAELIQLHLEEGGVPAAITRVDNRRSLGARLEEAGWDLVICDHHLPDLDSLRALEMVRQRRGDLPFIVVSGSIPEAEADEVRRLGARHVIDKKRLETLAPLVSREFGPTMGNRG